MVDVYAAFEALGNPSSLYASDELHLSSSGYSYWTTWATSALADANCSEWRSNACVQEGLGGSSNNDGNNNDANSDGSGCGGGCIGGIVGGCFVPGLVCILWLSGVFESKGCPSPFKKSKGTQEPCTVTSLPT